jgi:hypothetical protein
LIGLLYLSIVVFCGSLYAAEPSLTIELGTSNMYLYSSDLSEYIIDSKLQETIKAGITKKISFLITIFVSSDENDISLGNWEIKQEIRYDVWEEEFQVKYSSGKMVTFNDESKAYAAFASLRKVRIPIPSGFDEYKLFYAVLVVSTESFSAKEKEELQTWISPNAGKGISIQGLLDFFLDKGIKTKQKRFVVKSPLYKK